MTRGQLAILPENDGRRATRRIVKDHASGWVLLQSSTPAFVREVISAPDWPRRPMTRTWQMPPIPEVQPSFGQRKMRLS